MVNTLGILPKQWWESWEARSDFFDEDGLYNPSPDMVFKTGPKLLLERIQENGRKDDNEFSLDEAVALEKMLQTMLVYDPT
jgi:serine/threonine-protein kinase SRPK3